MASRPLLSPFQVMKNGNMSVSSVSAATIITNVSEISYTVNWSGSSPVGTLNVQVSNDFSLNAAGDVANPGTWTTIPNLSIAISGSPGNGFIDVQTAAYAIRLQYVPTSGSGLMQAFIAGKSA